MNKYYKFITLLTLILSLSSCGSNYVEPTPSPTATSTPTETPTISPTLVPTPATTETVVIETQTPNSNSAFEYQVYTYLDKLLKSPNNPANWSDIGDDVNAWQNKVNQYEENATKQTAQHFGISDKEAESIYLREAMK